MRRCFKTALASPAHSHPLTAKTPTITTADYFEAATPPYPVAKDSSPADFEAIRVQQHAAQKEGMSRS